MALDRLRHPCFSDTARHRFARIHLPVAPDCNVQCNFCRRVYDCANESRPGVTSALLSPRQALHYLEAVLKKDPRIAVVGIAGPGDPFATPEKTLETLRLVRERHPEMLLCVASNGLAVARYADELAALKVSHVTLTVNAVDPDIGAKVYAWVRDGKRVYRGRAGAQLLLDRQVEAIRALKAHGITVKINTIIVPGVNEGHVVEIARRMAELGADIANCVPLYPVPETPFATVEPPSPQSVTALRKEVATHLPIMEHCTRCRADAVGLLGEAMRPEIEICLLQSAAAPLNPEDERPYVAVATLEGVLVNQHLGEAELFSVFAHDAEGFHLVEKRQAPPPGGGSQRWQALAETLKDCRALLVASAGGSPTAVLATEGIEVIMMEGLIEEGLDAVYRGEPIRAPLRAQHRCGSGCAGSGLGCM
jgi:nitrogen fixation protein NifB